MRESHQREKSDPPRRERGWSSERETGRLRTEGEERVTRNVWAGAATAVGTNFFLAPQLLLTQANINLSSRKHRSHKQILLPSLPLFHLLRSPPPNADSRPGVSALQSLGGRTALSDPEKSLYCSASHTRAENWPVTGGQRDTLFCLLHVIIIFVSYYYYSDLSARQVG